MRCAKISVAVFGLVVCGVIGGVMLLEAATGEGGRLLTEREMAATFGDAGVNNMCREKGSCACTRKGSSCLKCDNERNEGKDTIWNM